MLRGTIAYDAQFARENVPVPVSIHCTASLENSVENQMSPTTVKRSPESAIGPVTRGMASDSPCSGRRPAKTKAARPLLPSCPAVPFLSGSHVSAGSDHGASGRLTVRSAGSRPAALSVISRRRIARRSSDLSRVAQRDLEGRRRGQLVDERLLCVRKSLARWPVQLPGQLAEPDLASTRCCRQPLGSPSALDAPDAAVGSELNSISITRQHQRRLVRRGRAATPQENRHECA